MELKITIRLAKPSDIRQYTDLLQRTYEAAYASEEHGLPKELFSKEIFNTEDTQRYLLSNLEQNENQRTWLAFQGEQLIGSITATIKGSDCEFRGFYVAPELQGKGIGRRLAELANQFAANRDIILDTYTHNTKTLAMY